MSVHYKFKSALDFDTISFDGLHISVSDLKKAIVHQKRLGKTGDFDLQITNAQTKEEYSDENSLIPKNTSLIIARIPLVVSHRKTWDPTEKVQNSRVLPEIEPSQVDLSRMNGSEEDKIKAMMAQSTMDYDPTNYQKIRGSNQTGEVPLNYRCYKCHKPGHWIKHCPYGGAPVKSFKDTEKRNTGIPRSFLEGGQQIATNTSAQTAPPPANDKTEIPEDLICGICKSLFVDAVMIPCCGSSFCDECVRTALLESEDNECPDCKEKGTSPASLIPNRFLRNSVNSFKNETGYSKPRPTQRQKVEELAKSEELSQKSEDPGESIEQPIQEVKEHKEQISRSKEVKSKDEDDSSSSSSTSSSSDDDTNSDENESDYEDNITVTVPPAHLTSHVAYKERTTYIGRHSHRLKPPGLDTPPKSHQHYQNSTQDERSATPTVDEKETYNTIPSTEHSRPPSVHPTAQTSSSQQQQHSQNQQQQPQQQQQQQQQHTGAPPSHPNQPSSHQQHDSSNVMSNQAQNGYGGPPNQMHYQQQHPVRYDGPEYQNAMHGGNYPPRPYDPMGGPYRHERPRQPYMQPRMPFPPMQNQMMRGQRHPIINDERYAQVYEGVQAKVGTGVIDDPLEVFNRIMREKERRKEEHRRRSPHIEHGRRSRSHEMDRRRPSMERRRTSRLRSPLERRGRSPEDRRGRSHVRESADRKRRRSSSFSHSSRSSRTYSRSRSPPMRKRSRSPVMRKRSRSMNRRSRSRSQSFSVNRFNNRYRENPRGGRGEGNRGDFGEFRDRSPFYNRGGRGGFRGRGRGHQMQFRQDRQQHNVYKDENNFGSQMSSNYHESGGQYGPQNANRFNQRDQPPLGRGGQQGYAPQLASLKQDPTYDNEMGYRERFDEGGPPGMDHEQPLPPGFEGERYDREGSYNSQQHYLNEYHRNNDGGDMNYPNNERNEREPRERERERDRGERDRERPPSRHEASRTRSPPIERGHHDIHRRHSKSKSKDRHESRKEKQRRDESSKKLSENVSSRDKEKNSESSKKRVEITTDDEKREKKASKEKKKKKKEGEKKKNKKEKKEKRRESEKEKKIAEKSSKRNKEEREMFDIPSEHHIEKEMFTPPPQPVPQPEEPTEHLQNEADRLLFNPEGGDLSTKPTIAEVFEQDMNEPDPQNEGTESQKVSPEQQEAINEEKQSPHNSSANSGSSPLNHLKHSDSILDIHANLDFDNEMIDLEDNLIKPQNNGEPSVLVPLPEPSKWERDEDSGVASEKKLTPSNESADGENDDRSGKVTNEVLKRAENAIFARAINAIRPIEIKKISLERQKLYSNDKNNLNNDDSSPVSLMIIRPASPIKESFQITVPANNRHSGERSVEIKTNVGDMPKPIKMSIKDRLGSKLTKSRSRTKSPSVQRVPIEINNNTGRRSPPPPAIIQPPTTSTSSSRTRRDREREDRPSRSRDDRRNQNNNNNSNIEQRSGSGNYRSNKDRKYSKDREQQQPQVQQQQQQHQNFRRDGGHDRNAQRNHDQRGSRDQQIRNRDRSFNEKGRDRRSHSKPKDKEKEKEKPGSTSRLRRSPAKRSRTPEKRDRNKDRSKNDQQTSSSSRNDDKKSNKKRSRSGSANTDRKKDKRNRKDDKENQNSGENLAKEKTDRNEKSGDKKRDKTPVVRPSGEKESSNKSDRKRTTIDEANFVPDYEQMDHEQQLDSSAVASKQGKNSNTNNNTEQNADRQTQIQKPVTETGPNRHRHRSPSSEQSSSSTDSDSSAETDESSHRRKKRKHKKQKKSKKVQPTSSDTDESPRKKKKKDKKSKSSKKKKKSKHK